MAYFLSPVLNEQQFDADGNPLAGGFIHTYLAGTTTPEPAYKTSTGTVHANPIELDSAGNYPTGTQLWLDGGKVYKFVVTDADGNVLRTIDNITGINDISQSVDEWVQYTATEIAYLSANSFSVEGDQTNEFHVGRRVKAIATGGTVYGSILTSAYTSLTTVTLAMDAGQAIDSGLSVIYLSILTAVNAAIPAIIPYSISVSGSVSVSGNATNPLEAVPLQQLDAAVAAVNVTQIQPISASVGSNALTISSSALKLDFRSTTLDSGSVTRVSGTPANLVISSGSTLGTINAVQSDIVVLAINNAGTIELAAVNIAGGTDLSEAGLITTTAEGGAGAADSISTVYSTTARANLAYRVLGVIRSTQATAGTWATSPSLIQGAGGQALTAMSSLGYGQTWQSVTRTSGVTYYNTTGKPIELALTVQPSSSASVAIGGVNLHPVGGITAPASCRITSTFTIPPEQSYLISVSGGSIATFELR